MAQRPKPPLPVRVKRAKSRVRKLIPNRPRETVNIQHHSEVKSYLTHTYNVARALQEWSDLMLHSLQRRERAYAEHLSSTSREKKWTLGYNKWLIRQLKLLDRRKLFWEARMRFAKNLEWRTLNGLRLVYPSKELDLVIKQLMRKQSDVSQANQDLIALRQRISSQKPSRKTRALAKEYWEVALRHVESTYALARARNEAFSKYALTFSPQTRGALKHQVRELQKMIKGIRQTIQEIDRGEGDGGADYAFV